jgi:hypothetical protein
MHPFLNIPERNYWYQLDIDIISSGISPEISMRKLKQSLQQNLLKCFNFFY